MEVYTYILKMTPSCNDPLKMRGSRRCSRFPTESSYLFLVANVLISCKLKQNAVTFRVIIYYIFVLQFSEMLFAPSLLIVTILTFIITINLFSLSID